MRREDESQEPDELKKIRIHQLLLYYKGKMTKRQREWGRFEDIFLKHL